MNDLADDIERLAPLLAMREAMDAKSTPAQKARNAKAASLLLKLFEPQELAELVLCASEVVTEAKRHIQTIVEGQEMKESLDSASMNLQEAGHQLHSKMKVWKAKGAARSEVASKAAYASHANVREAKARVKEHWKNWYAGRPPRYGSAADFARCMIELESNIKDIKSIERWVTKWQKEAKPK
jgi:hypothetical protein